MSMLSCPIWIIILRIAIISPFFLTKSRGIEQYSWYLASALTRQRIQVDILTWNARYPVEWDSNNPLLKIRAVPYFRYFMAYLAVPFYISWLITNQYDFVFFFFAGYGEGYAIRFVDKIKSISTCMVFHFPYELVPHRYLEFERFDLIARAHRLIAVSNHVAAQVEKRYARDCSVIENGVDSARFQPSIELRSNIRRMRGISSNSYVLVTVAALEERKGIQYLLNALPYLLKDFPDIEYWILGEGSYRNELKLLIEKLGLIKNVRLKGQVTDVVPFLAASDLGVLLSVGEAHPIALLEYLSMELPVVTSDSPPFDVMVREEWGVCINVNNLELLVDEIAKILSDSIRRQMMGKNARQHILDHYNWDGVAKQYLDLLDKP